MSGGKWTTQQIIDEKSDLVTKWRCEGQSTRVIAKKLEEETGRACTRGVIQHVLEKLDLVKQKPAARIEVEDHSEQPDEMPIEDLIKNRIKASQRKKSKANEHRRNITLPAEPVGLMIFGDPHVDNEGCDFAQLHDHVSLAQRTEGVLAACVGDLQDNWIGRLARIYCEASVTASNGWRLSEWFLSSMQWIAIVGGNHDAWAHGPGVDPLKWLSKSCGVTCYAQDEIRISINWKGEPELDPVVWVLRHDFGGRSWYHPTHGPHKEAMLDGRCHLLTAGHIHQWGQLTTEQRHDRITNALRVRGYKRNDSYARQKGFSEQSFGEACLVVIDPWEVGPGRITVFWDLVRGCEFLTFLREKRKTDPA